MLNIETRDDVRDNRLHPLRNGPDGRCHLHICINGRNEINAAGDRFEAHYDELSRTHQNVAWFVVDDAQSSQHEYRRVRVRRLLDGLPHGSSEAHIEADLDAVTGAAVLLVTRGGEQRLRTIVPVAEPARAHAAWWYGSFKQDYVVPLRAILEIRIDVLDLLIALATSPVTVWTIDARGERQRVGFAQLDFLTAQRHLERVAKASSENLAAMTTLAPDAVGDLDDFIDACTAAL